MDSYLAEVALHYGLAGAAADPAKLIDYSTRAGMCALDVRAYAESIRFFSEAIIALQVRGASPRALAIWSTFVANVATPT
jgi:hypothetical protein